MTGCAGGETDIPLGDDEMDSLSELVRDREVMEMLEVEVYTPGMRKVWED